MFVPPALPLGVDVTDLAADEAHVAAVEVAAEVESSTFLAIPGADEETAVKTCHVNGQVESLWIAG